MLNSLELREMIFQKYQNSVKINSIIPDSFYDSDLKQLLKSVETRLLLLTQLFSLLKDR
jgi:hypothetical protein